MTTDTMSPPAVSPNLATRVFGSPWSWVAWVVLLMTYHITRSVLAPTPEPLPVLGHVSEFALTDHFGKPFGTQNLNGKAWVGNFIFTRCQTVCPAFTTKMQEIQHRSRGLGEAFHLVSFTADPDYDTPERLLEYARKFKASKRNWSFVTGGMDDVKNTVTKGLRVAMGNEAPDGNPGGIFHGSHFVLVDTQGQIRGYYDSTDADAIDRVLQAAGQLLSFGT